MSVTRIMAIARKEWIQVRRDRLSLAMAFLLPVILLIIYAYAITFDVDNILLVVYDRDKSSTSRDLVAQFTESGYFTEAARVGSYGEIDRYLDSDQARIALVIPFDFSKNIRKGRPASVEVIIDGSNSNTAAIAQGYVASIADQFSRRQESPPIRPVIDLRNRVWYNPALKSRNFVIPGLIALIMSVIVSVLTSLTIAREWDRGTMEQLISTPVRPAELLVGKLIPYMLIGFADTILSVFIATVLLDVPLRGSIPLLGAASAIFLVGGLCFGVLISAGARNQLLASQLGMLTSFLPSFLLSGFVFSIANMPAPLRAFTYAVPARYFVSILNGVFLKGIGLRFLALEMGLLSLYAVVVFLLAKRKIRKRLD
ncbi:MAG: ABC transporter permease [Syntrophorhabdales bacterium]|jgi:ABC-2 type transport system permease protein